MSCQSHTEHLKQEMMWVHVMHWHLSHVHQEKVDLLLHARY
jgi:hypothetical protein